MFIDDVTIKVKAGAGGAGAVAFNKNLMSLGPAGGSGGQGGSIYAQGVSDLNALIQFRNKKEIIASDGGNGKVQFIDGSDGEDIILKLPVGTVIHNLDTAQDQEIIKIGEEIILAKGGRGGKGNFHFRSSINTSPKQFQTGKPGEIFNLRLELKLIADIGLIGLPNAGKSSLLNELTAAKSKVANYPFTTLEPNLGVYFDLILADIPGLIEGAASGRGLGVKFLRHIERTKTLFHLISCESVDPIADYQTIRKELENYNQDLLNKNEIVFLSKTDMVNPKELNLYVKKLKKFNPQVYGLSIHDQDSLDQVKKILNQIQKNK